ncbi:MAG TPA: hypothetical protein VFV72_16950 [Candidatus Limnocylindrales bacterium]|nr:hypothetical protein [Candidatus Limnocylindrales bacterium]
MTAFERDGTEVEALLTDLYLERVLARAGTDLGPGDADLDPALRRASDRLRHDLTRVHPSFRFEERLALRLAEAAAAARLPRAAGEGGAVVSLPASSPGRGGDDDGFDPLADPADDDDRRELPVPLIVGGALTSAAISLAGAAAYVAWRWARPSRSGSPMVRAARAVRELHRAGSATST